MGNALQPMENPLGVEDPPQACFFQSGAAPPQASPIMNKKTKSTPVPADTDASRESDASTPRRTELLGTLDNVLQALRSRRISLSLMNAVTTLYLSGDNELRLTDLARLLGVSTAATTNLADSLEGHGFAMRSVDPHDRRLTYITITSRGKAFAEWLHDSLSLPVEPRLAAG